MTSRPAHTIHCAPALPSYLAQRPLAQQVAHAFADFLQSQATTANHHLEAYPAPWQELLRALPQPLAQGLQQVVSWLNPDDLLQRGVRAGANVISGVALTGVTALAAVGSLQAAAQDLSKAVANNLPTGGQIVAGQGQIQQPNANTVVVQQDSQRLVTNWQSFNVGAGQTVIFNQPNSSAIALNRVLGNSRSEIAGSIQANGQVYLLNPNGILFSPTSQISVGALVAGTQQITDADFMANRLNFQGTQQPNAEVINQGTLSVNDNGHVVLLGQVVKNQGVISAGASGQVVLAAGDAVSLTPEANGIKVKVTTESIRALVENQGLIVTAGGQVLLSAHGRDLLTQTVVNNSGVIRASSLADITGEVTLDGGNSGAVVHSGQIDVSAASAGVGGKVVLAGQYVGVVGQGQIDATGAQGGGTVLMGGDYLGQDSSTYTYHRAQRAIVDAGAQIDVSATEQGQGGKAIVWSDEATRFDGQINASGGTRGAATDAGGFIETSGKEFLSVNGQANAQAYGAGTAGLWLLDPTDITISNGTTANAINNGGTLNLWTGNASTATINVVNITNALNSGTSVCVTTASGATGAGNINVTATINKNNGVNASLTLAANGQININNADILASGRSDQFNLTLTAPLGVHLSNTQIQTNSGVLSINANAASTFNNVTLRTDSSQSTINVTSTNATAISFQGSTSIATPNGSLTINGNSTNNSGINFNQSRLTLDTASNVSFNGNSTSSNTSIAGLVNIGTVVATDAILTFNSNKGQLFLNNSVAARTLSLDAPLGILAAPAITATNLKLTTNAGEVNLINAANLISSVEITSARTVELHSQNRLETLNITANGTVNISSNSNIFLLRDIAAGGNVTLSAGVGKPLEPAALNGNLTGGDVVRTGNQQVQLAAGQGLTIYSGNANSDSLLQLVSNASSPANFQKTYGVLANATVTPSNKTVQLFYRVQPKVIISGNKVTVTYSGAEPTQSAGLFSIDGLIDGDSVTLGPNTFSPLDTKTQLSTGRARNVGDYITVASLVELSMTGYERRNENGMVTITPANVTLAPTPVNKIYDGTTRASTSLLVVAGNLFATDRADATNYLFDTRHVGTNKTVSAQSLQISDGNQGRNYNVTLLPDHNSTISPATLRIKAPTVTKPIDLNTDASGNISVTGLAATDRILTYQLQFDTPLAGDNKIVRVTGVTLEDGNNGQNYALELIPSTNNRIRANSAADPFLDYSWLTQHILRINYYVAPRLDEKYVNRLIRLEERGMRLVPERFKLSSSASIAPT